MCIRDRHVSVQTSAAAFTDRFVQRPVLAIVISLLLVLLGAYSGTRLGVKETPSVESPVVTVTTTWPGAEEHEEERDHDRQDGPLDEAVRERRGGRLHAHVPVSYTHLTLPTSDLV